MIEKEVLLPSFMHRSFSIGAGRCLEVFTDRAKPVKTSHSLQDCKTKKPASAGFFSSSLAAHNAYAGARATYDYLVSQETHYRQQ